MGRAFGGDLPKQYARLSGTTLLERTASRLLEALTLDALFVALSPSDIWYRTLVDDRCGDALYCRGSSRAETVVNALEALADRCRDDDWILVHDVARPCVPVEALRRLVDELGDHPVGGLLAIPVADTLKEAEPSGAPRVGRTRSRAGLWHAQAPQMFRYGVLRAALARDGASATDEAQAVERLAQTGGCPMPSIIHGSALNIRIAEETDLDIAAAILAAQERR